MENISIRKCSRSEPSQEGDWAEWREVETGMVDLGVYGTAAEVQPYIDAVRAVYEARSQS